MTVLKKKKLRSKPTVKKLENNLNYIWRKRMNWKTNILKVIFIIFFALLMMNCTERIPPGYVGMVMTVDGLTGKVLQPGKHACWGRDMMYLVETVEDVNTEKMQILCPMDDLNLDVDIKIRSRCKSTDGKGIMQVFNKQGSKLENFKKSS